MNAPSIDIRDRIAAHGLAVVGAMSGWSLGVALEPDRPDSTVTVYDLTGAPPAVVEAGYLPAGIAAGFDQDAYSKAGAPVALQSPAVQVRVRARAYEDAYAKQHDIRQLLTVPTSWETDGARYVAVTAETDVNSLGRDENNRHRLVINYRIMRHER